VLGIVLATFFSDFGHEMCTAVLPLYLAAVQLGPASLGQIEGLADFLASLAKLVGGVVGHRLRRKRPWAALGYLVTTLATAAIALTSSLAPLVALRGTAWVGRGFRGPLRDYLLADAVEPTHYGRAYGLERAGDMLGAVAGPLAATLLVWLGIELRSIILLTLAPGLVATSAMFLMVRERSAAPSASETPGTGETRGPGGHVGTGMTSGAVGNIASGETASRRLLPRFPRGFWFFLVGVGLFGLGDFSRTFLIWLAARQLGEEATRTAGVISVAVLLYTLHNLVSAGAAFPIGQLGDRFSKTWVLLIGYLLGACTNALLALWCNSLGWLVLAIVLSGVYIAAEETLEKAVAASFLPRELRSLGFGILACVNAVGDMASSLYVGFLLEAGHFTLAFAMAAAVGLLGTIWIAVFAFGGWLKPAPTP
jgi:MFS family permease